MLAFRALLFAVLGGFIAAAPAAPVAPDREGHDAGGAAAGKPQKSEQAGYEGDTPSARDCAGAPPTTDTPGPGMAVLSPERSLRPPEPPCGPPCPSEGARPLPPAADVRAGLLDLPPPPR
jgi:hypothetical protein